MPIREPAAMALARRVLLPALPGISEEALQLAATIIMNSVKADELEQEIYENERRIVRLRSVPKGAG